MTDSAAEDTDVLVAGGGVAGLAAAVSLGREGLRVRCIEPRRTPRVRVGESLDWSAPSLLETLGLHTHEIVARGDGTYKREIHGFTATGRRLVAGPPGWFAAWPLRFETVTMHVDRERFDARLVEAAREAGVDFVWDRIRDVHMLGDRVVGCSTASGASYRARWYVDASGRSRLFGRSAHIGTRTWGDERIALWAQRPSTRQLEGTTLHLDETAEALAWAWEIPINADRSSVGVVLPVDEFKRTRTTEPSLDRTFAALLGRFPRLDPPSDTATPRSRTYQPYVSDRIVGANWVMVGEAAALVDPLSAIGVTMAVRHGNEAARIIVDDRRAHRRTADGLAAFDRRVRRIGTLYNDAITDLLYGPRLRRWLGLKQAARAYIIPGYLTNAVYSRLRPEKSPGRNAAFGLFVEASSAWTQMWVGAARARALAQRSTMT